MTPRAQRRICGLCGRAVAVLIPEGVGETERDRLCRECLRLPPPPRPGGEPGRGGVDHAGIRAGVGKGKIQKAKGEWALGACFSPLFWLCTPAKVGAFGRFELPPRAASTLQAATTSSGGVPSMSYRVPPLAEGVKFERVEDRPTSCCVPPVPLVSRTSTTRASTATTNGLGHAAANGEDLSAER
jgi:hypothetical protein